MAETTQEQWVALRLFVTTSAVITGGVITVIFSLLRETPQFWTNAGGYPIFLRDLVLIGYYPLMAINGITLFILTALCCSRISVSRKYLFTQLGLLIVGWSLFSGSLAISMQNNIRNFLEGRPIHSHSDP